MTPPHASEAPQRAASSARTGGSRSERRLGTPRRLARRLRDDAGAATAEYVIATMAAVGFAGLLVVILASDEVRQVLTDMVRTALSVP